MNIVAVCGNCGKELRITDSHVKLANEIVIDIEVCACNTTSDDGPGLDTCENCEDLATWQKRAEQAEAKLKYLKKLLNEDEKKEAQPACNCGQHLLKKGVHVPSCMLHHTNKPAQPTNKPVEVQRHATPTEKTQVNILQSTEDVVSTGGTIVPGVKKGSAKQSQAAY